MKVAFPVGKESGTEQPVAEHFGPSPYFLVFCAGGKAKASMTNFQRNLSAVERANAISTTIRNTSTHFGGDKMPVELLAEKGVDSIVCCDMGPKAVQMCAKHSIDVYFAKAGASVEEAFALHLQGKLKKAVEGDGCESHSH